MRLRLRHFIVLLPALALWEMAASAVEPAAAQARIAKLEKMLANSPDDGGLLYELAVSQTAVGHHTDAVRSLEKAVASGWDFDPRVPAFLPLAKLADFQTLERTLAGRPTARTSTLAFRIADPDLLPEGMAWDPNARSFYVGSLARRKILRVGPDGATADFVASGRDGLWAVLGLTVDAKRRLLWANSAADPREGEAAGSSGLFAFELETGRLREKHVLNGRQAKHLLNDLAIAADGTIYVTDSEGGGIWRLAPGGSSLEEFLPAKTFDYPNGIALSGGRLYVADAAKGISIVELDGKRVRPLPHPAGVSLFSVDGLYAFRGGLVAIQNGPGMDRVVQFRLDPPGDRVVSLRIVESGNPDFRTPTTGAIVGTELFYMANTQLTDLRDDGTLEPGSKRRDVLVFKAPLD